MDISKANLWAGYVDGIRTAHRSR